MSPLRVHTVVVLTTPTLVYHAVLSLLYSRHFIRAAMTKPLIVK